MFTDCCHPFLEKYTDNVAECAEKMLSKFHFHPSSYEMVSGNLRVHFNSGYYKTGYKESPECICYSESYHDSYHDGGGSGFKLWQVYKAEADKNNSDHLKEVIGEEFLKSVPLPICKNVWAENDHVYIEEPWGLSGIFEFYSHTEYREDFESENIIEDTGVPHWKIDNYLLHELHE